MTHPSDLAKTFCDVIITHFFRHFSLNASNLDSLCVLVLNEKYSHSRLAVLIEYEYRQRLRTST